MIASHAFNTKFIEMYKFKKNVIMLNQSTIDMLQTACFIEVLHALAGSVRALG